MSSVGEDPSAFFQRLEKASGVHHANLLEVIRALEETGEFWVVSRLGTGVPLNTLLKGSRLRSGCAVAVGMGILSGLTALHQAGLWHGSVHGRNVHVDLDGSVKLGDHCLSPAPAGQSSAALRAADVRAAGALICTMLRVPLENAPPAGQRQALKMASSPLGLAAKAIAGPPRKLPAGYEAAHASLTLWEAARKMATSRRQAQARHDLATMVMAALGAPRPTVVQTRDRQESERSRRSAPGTSSAPATQAAASASAEAPAAAPATPAGSTLPAPALPTVPAPPPIPSPVPARQAGESRGLPSPPQPGQPAPTARLESAGALAAAPPARTAYRTRVPVVGVPGASRHAPAGVPWSLLALLAAALLLAVCVLMAVASAVPIRRPSATPVRPAPTLAGPVPTAQASPLPAAPGLPSFGDVPVTTPIVVVPAAPGSAPAAPPAPAGRGAAPPAPAAPPVPATGPGTAGTIPPGPGAAPAGPPPPLTTAPLPALADLPPASAGDVLSVSLDVTGCAPASACTISVEVALRPTGSRRTVNWTLSSVDLCTGRTAQLASISVVAQPGWNHVIGLSTVTMPAASAQVLVAITDSPARAASSLASAGSNHCP